MTFPGAKYIDLLDQAQRRTMAARPEELFEIVRGNEALSTFIIDEIQKVPELLSVIHALIEENKERQFILTGSSARNRTLNTISPAPQVFKLFAGKILF